MRNRMRENGLAKLVEEIGEVGQIAGKMIQFPELRMNDAQNHPSGYNLRRKMEEEMADVLASIRYVTEKLYLDTEAINVRAARKLTMFHEWGAESDV